MKKIAILLTTLMISCATPKMFVADLNVVGKVIKITKCDCPDGGFIYLVQIDPESKQYVRYITDASYNIGDYVYFHTIVKKEDTITDKNQ